MTGTRNGEDPETYWTYVDGSESRGRPSGRPDPRSQQNNGEKSGLANRWLEGNSMALRSEGARAE